LNLKRGYSRFLKGLRGRLHFAAHSHHLWPDATRGAALRCWDDAAALADRKWDRVFGAVVPEAQRHVARVLSLSRPENVAFAPNTHEFVRRLLSCLDLSRPLRVLTTDSEFHSLARQLARLEELPNVRVRRVPVEPFSTFEARFAKAARAGAWDLIAFSQVFFDSGFAIYDLESIVRAAPAGAIVTIDGYHAFCALPVSLKKIERRAFYIGGGYKYAQAGEGACFLAVPPGCRLRPLDTGWFADFAALEGPREAKVGYARDAFRFWGATFDPTGLYRFNAAMRWLNSRRLTTKKIHGHILELQNLFLAGLNALGSARLGRRNLLTPVDTGWRGHFLAFRMKRAARAHAELRKLGIDTDFRGDRLRFGFGLYHDAQDVRELCRRLRRF